MVHVRDVRMFVHELLVPVPMRVRLTARVVRPMDMLMVRIMDVRMAVLLRLVHVLVVMMLGQVQPDAERHERARSE
jgi:hypothetical protein